MQHYELCACQQRAAGEQSPSQAPPQRANVLLSQPSRQQCTLTPLQEPPSGCTPPLQPTSGPPQQQPRGQSQRCRTVRAAGTSVDQPALEPQHPSVKAKSTARRGAGLGAAELLLGVTIHVVWK